MIDTDDVTRMVVELETGKKPSLNTPEADEFRERLRREIAEIKRNGYDIDAPFEIPDVDDE